MASVLKKAAKGNRAALVRLYNQTKKEALFLAQQLLLDDRKATITAEKAYRDILALSVLETIDNEDAFVQKLQTSVVTLCQSLLTQKNPKAFRLPTDRRFDIRTVPADRPADDVGAVQAVFSDLQRLIFVLHTASKLSEDRILRLVKLDSRTYEEALAAEQQNLALLTDTPYEQFCKNFVARADSVSTAELDDAVEAIIDDVVAPIKKAAQKRTWITVLAILGACALMVGFSALLIWDMTHPKDTASDDSSTQTTTTTNAAQATVGTVTTVTPTHYADIDIKDYGVITVALDCVTAPETVTNFMMLADSGFYDGLTFHRIMEGFMMQGGDPKGNGTGGSDETITGEFAANGIENPLSHVRGAISMARSEYYDSASSQFFIVHEDSLFLDGDYAVFGYVTEGMDIVDAICTAAEPIDDNGTIPSEQQPIINTITVRSAA